MPDSQPVALQTLSTGEVDSIPQPAIKVAREPAYITSLNSAAIQFNVIWHSTDDSQWSQPNNALFVREAGVYLVTANVRGFLHYDVGPSGGQLWVETYIEAFTGTNYNAIEADGHWIGVVTGPSSWRFYTHMTTTVRCVPLLDPAIQGVASAFRIFYIFNGAHRIQFDPLSTFSMVRLTPFVES